ncbi:MAG: hypothetical protein LBN36_07845 [Clostridiales Family XIII bacterium]|nr:hypothetical protein [Clostridiales Family XIII bacterium]
MDTLEGKRIGLVWAAFGNGDVLLEALGALIKERYPSAELVHMNPGKNLKPSEYSDPSIMDVARENEIDAAIVTVGGCGTCTPGVTRAVCWIEEAGIPATAMICKGFVNPSRSMASMEGLKAIRITELPPPNIVTQTREEVFQNAAIIFDQMIEDLTSTPIEGKTIGRKENKTVNEKEVVFTGTYEEVNEHFLKEGWGDGLPIVPPTVEAIKRMLQYTDYPEDQVIATLKPSGTSVTPWSVAANGVMAGCRPSYMPILIALLEAVGEERFAVQHAGSTAGWTPVIFLNGPIRRELNFNCGQGVLRPGTQANMSIGRFLRFVWTNFAGFKIGSTDLAAIGRNFMPVLAENEENSPYDPLATDFGFQKGQNVVTVQSCGSMTFHFTSEATPEEHLEILAREVKKELQGEFIHCLSAFGDEIRPALVLSPMVANILSEAGYSKQDIRDYIFEHARVTAATFDFELNRLYPGYNVAKIVADGLLPASWASSDDPERLLPLTHNATELVIVVAGFESRNRSCILQQIAHQGLPCAKEIKLPKNWDSLPK